MHTRARALVERLSLQPHPEGGWYREVYRSSIRVDAPAGDRSALTTILYLLENDQPSRWHVVEADEAWHFYGGAPLELLAYDPAARSLRRRMLATPREDAPGTGASGTEGEPVAVIERGVWQAARALGEFSLVGCTVGPGFEFEDFRFVASLPGHAEHFTGAMSALSALL